MPSTSFKRHDALIVVLSLAFVLGMAVALILVLVWRSHPGTMSVGGGYHAALLVCPPFLLVQAVSGLSDNMLALVLATGSIVFANGALYAGLAAFGTWVVKTVRPFKSRP